MSISHEQSQSPDGGGRPLEAERQWRQSLRPGAQVIIRDIYEGKELLLVGRVTHLLQSGFICAYNMFVGGILFNPDTGISKENATSQNSLRSGPNSNGEFFLLEPTPQRVAIIEADERRMELYVQISDVLEDRGHHVSLEDFLRIAAILGVPCLEAGAAGQAQVSHLASGESESVSLPTEALLVASSRN